MRADFTSALYLGMRHAAQSLPAWAELTLGKPAALEPVQAKLAPYCRAFGYSG